jgi:hypothetical protein
MEQRIGRIDRVRSQTDRRLGTLTSPLVQGIDKLQVYYPYLEDTVEVLQVDRVLARMQEFLRLMHENLVFHSKVGSSIDTSAEMPRGRQVITPIAEHLKTAFPVREELISGELSPLAAVKSDAEAVRLRFSSIRSTPIEGLKITWEDQTDPGVIHGTIALGKRIQPLTLLQRSVGKHHSVRCISPIGSLRPDENQERLAAGANGYDVRIGAILTSEIRTYDLTIEDEVLLSLDARTDGTRIGQLILRVAKQADLVEQKQLPGRDEHLATFRKDLDAEVSRDR